MDSVNGIHGTKPTPLMIYEMLEDRFGFQGWWPGRNNFEILVGAMLTQQTSWKNVDMALLNLRKGGLLSLDALAGADLHELDIYILSIWAPAEFSISAYSKKGAVAT